LIPVVRGCRIEIAAAADVVGRRHDPDRPQRILIRRLPGPHELPYQGVMLGDVIARAHHHVDAGAHESRCGVQRHIQTHAQVSGYLAVLSFLRDQILLKRSCDQNRQYQSFQ
jgi:hypothetical protein